MSAVGLGAAELGLTYGTPGCLESPPTEAEASALLDAAVDLLGITLIDTAPAYGESEAVLGRLLGDRRARVVLATKVSPAPPGEDPTSWVVSSLEGSLGRLRTSRCDLVQLHSADEAELRSGRTLGGLEQARRRGLTLHVGATTYGEEAALAALDDDRVDVIQIAYNLLDRRAEERVLARSASRGVGVLARSVYLRGVLSPRVRTLPPEMLPLRAQVEQFADGIPGGLDALPGIAIRFVLGHPSVASALVGTTHVTELRRAVEAASAGPLPPDVVRRILTVPPTPGRLLDPRTWPTS